MNKETSLREAEEGNDKRTEIKEIKRHLAAERINKGKICSLKLKILTHLQ